MPINIILMYVSLIVVTSSKDNFCRGGGFKRTRLFPSEGSMADISNRAGKYVRQPANYRAFIPSPLPPSPPLDLTGEMQCLLNDAALELGRLDGMTVNLPNPDLFLSMYVRKEALLSSQIEGTQASLDDVLEYEVISSHRKRAPDA